MATWRGGEDVFRTLLRARAGGHAAGVVIHVNEPQRAASRGVVSAAWRRREKAGSSIVLTAPFANAATLSAPAAIVSPGHWSRLEWDNANVA